MSSTNGMAVIYNISYSYTQYSHVHVHVCMHSYCITGYFPRSKIFLNGEPLASAEIFLIQKFTITTTKNLTSATFHADITQDEYHHQSSIRGHHVYRSVCTPVIQIRCLFVNENGKIYQGYFLKSFSFPFHLPLVHTL